MINSTARMRRRSTEGLDLYAHSLPTVWPGVGVKNEFRQATINGELYYLTAS